MKLINKLRGQLSHGLLEAGGTCSYYWVLQYTT
jgi:hypothetical protein